MLSHYFASGRLQQNGPWKASTVATGTIDAWVDWNEHLFKGAAAGGWIVEAWRTDYDPAQEPRRPPEALQPTASSVIQIEVLLVDDITSGATPIPRRTDEWRLSLSPW